MFTIPELVEEAVKRAPFIEEALSQGLINYSSLARKLRPELEHKLYKTVSEGAIVMALTRLSEKLEKKNPELQEVLTKLTDITVRSNLVEYAFDNSSTLLESQHKLIASLVQDKTNFFTFSQGVFETSLFISSAHEKEVEELFAKEKLRTKMTNLSAITIILPKEAVFIPGVYYSMLKALAWEGIYFIEIVSSYTEVTIILDNESVDKAFSILKNLSSNQL